MTRGELIDTLCAKDRTPSAENTRLLHELEMHQVELEMQNRQLREAQEELEASRARYLDLFDLAPVAYCIFDRNGAIEDANVMAATLLRMNRAALIGVPFSRVVTVAEKQTFADHIARCLNEEVRVTTELTVVVRGRGELVLQMVSTPHLPRGTRVTSCRTMLNDITRLKRSESVLRFVAGVDEGLASALDTDSLLATIGSACIPTLADACFLDLCDGDRGPLRRVQVVAPGQSDTVDVLKKQAFDPAWRRYEAQLVQSLAPVFEPGSAAALGARFEAMSGARGLLLLPLVARGRTLGVLGALMTQSGRTYSLQDFELGQDVARRVAMALDNALAYDRSQSALRSREQILSTVSQELRARLDEIASGVEALGDGDAAGDVRRAAKRMDRIVGHLLDVATLDTDHVPVIRRPHDIAELVDDAVAAHASSAKERSVTMGRETSAGLIASCDRDRVRQVLDGFIEGAIKATPSGGTVRVRAERTGTVIRTCVIDGGPAIDDELLEWVFDPTWHTRAEGVRASLGLATYVARSIIEAQGGTVGVTSAPEGATFFFTLPAADPRRTEQRPATAPSQPRPAVVLVDRDAETRRALVEDLQRHGFSVFEADDLVSASGELRSAQSPPAALIVDRDFLRRERGRAALADLRSDPALAPIPLILVGSADGGDDASAFGATVCLEKPVSVDELLATLDN